jgi:hypothetical protein
VVSICTFARTGSVDTQAPPIDLALAESYFHEAEEMSRRDNSKLWGKQLYGPMLFVDPDTRFVVTNQPDLEGRLHRQGSVFTGTLPRDENTANTAMNWAGVKWTMIMWPVPQDRQDRTRLMAHELFHRIQDELGLPGSNPANLHLDTRDGRIWLQMEWRALERALRATATARRQSIEDALAFRKFRRSMFPKSAAEENDLEINEGLAEYTGVKFSTHSKAELAAAAGCELRQARRKPTFVRSFAYISGPAYGELLDETTKDWRRQLKSNKDLGLVLQKAMAITSPSIAQQAVLKRTRSYDGETLIAEETRKDNLHQELLAKFRTRLIDQPLLVLPLSPAVKYSYNPNNLVGLGEIGTVYPTMRVSDNWGVIEVSKGALLIRDKGSASRLQVPLATDLKARPLKGDGWILELSEGWILDPGERKGDYVLKGPGVPGTK